SEKGLITEANLTAANLFGVTKNQLLKQPVSRFIMKEDQDIYYLQSKRLFETGKKQQFDIRMTQEKGEVFWANFMCVAVRANDGSLSCNAIIKNITVRKQAEFIIQKQNQKLLEINATKDKLFSIIAHDLKSPFSAILGLSDLLVKNNDKYERKKIQEFAVNINNLIKEIFKLLENLLEWSRIQSGMLTPNFQKYNLKTIFYDIRLLCSEMAKSKNITLRNLISTDIFVHCDVEMIKTVLRNLISNAIKFTDNNGFVLINARQHNSFIEIQVTDTGVGIPPEKISSLFQIGNNINQAGTAGETGTGLGLLLCKEFVAKHGGEIWVESEVGKGSTFSFTIKQVENEKKWQ
ncbi:MAG: PAS domain-containing sensor histidine kinase, partial [Bacteroidales bacterium]|nr:PAS domain-containing sensor histidine kinase [Bacteroidales bacterium]